MAAPVEVDFLVVGAGPAGLSTACFLAQHGLKALMISSAPGTADTPRAHLVNPFAIECLRDIGLEDDAYRMGVEGEATHIFRWCRSILGQEYGKVQMWGGEPGNGADVVRATPCKFIDLPQSYLEPIMLRYATTNGITSRFSTELTAFSRGSDGVITATLRDKVFNTTHEVRTRYLFGADGGRSTVGRAGKFKYDSKPSGGVACNIVFEADLTGRMGGAEAEINWVLKPDAKSRLGNGVAVRQIRPWKQWMIVAVTPGTEVDPLGHLKPDSPELIAGIKETIGAEDVEVKVHRLDSWVIRESVAEHFSDGRDIFILGDAAHRHPPAYGLGSNTCIQDGYNLAWKVALVSKGLAGPELLDTYSAERQPVGAQLVREANAELGAHVAVWKALGMLERDPAEGKRHIDLLTAPGEEGDNQRAELYASLEGKRKEGQSIGIDMNQWYDRKDCAVYLADEAKPLPPFEGDLITNIRISTYPGLRLPHAWLTKGNINSSISTQDVAGNAAFTLIVGNGGAPWREAAEKIRSATGIPITAVGIGHGLEYHDKFRDWRNRREVGENGCVLVRPDRYVCWRSMGKVQDAQTKLQEVLDHVLFRKNVKLPNGR